MYFHVVINKRHGQLTCSSFTSFIAFSYFFKWANKVLRKHARTIVTALWVIDKQYRPRSGWCLIWLTLNVCQNWNKNDAIPLYNPEIGNGLVELVDFIRLKAIKKRCETI